MGATVTGRVGGQDGAGRAGAGGGGGVGFLCIFNWLASGLFPWILWLPVVCVCSLWSVRCWWLCNIHKLKVMLTAVTYFPLFVCPQLWFRWTETRSGFSCVTLQDRWVLFTLKHPDNMGGCHMICSCFVLLLSGFWSPKFNLVLKVLNSSF